jgi:hypothetical protein
LKKIKISFLIEGIISLLSGIILFKSLSNKYNVEGLIPLLIEDFNTTYLSVLLINLGLLLVLLAWIIPCEK